MSILSYDESALYLFGASNALFCAWTLWCVYYGNKIVFAWIYL